MLPGRAGGCAGALKKERKVKIVNPKGNSFFPSREIKKGPPLNLSRGPWNFYRVLEERWVLKNTSSPSSLFRYVNAIKAAASPSSNVSSKQTTEGKKKGKKKIDSSRKP